MYNVIKNEKGLLLTKEGWVSENKDAAVFLKNVSFEEKNYGIVSRLVRSAKSEEEVLELLSKQGATFEKQ